MKTEKNIKYLINKDETKWDFSLCTLPSPVEKESYRVNKRDTNNSLSHLHHVINKLQSLPISWNPLL